MHLAEVRLKSVGGCPCVKVDDVFTSLLRHITTVTDSNLLQYDQSHEEKNPCKYYDNVHYATYTRLDKSEGLGTDERDE